MTRDLLLESIATAKELAARYKWSVYGHWNEDHFEETLDPFDHEVSVYRVDRFGETIVYSQDAKTLMEVK